MRDERLRIEEDSEEKRVLYLHLLGVRVAIASERVSLLERYRIVFANLAIPFGSEHPHLSVEIGPDGDAFRVVVEQAGQRTAQRLPDEDRSFAFVYALLLDRVTRHDPRLLCVHAAAVARDGRAIAIAAASGHGKSTLTLALAASGYAFLSDEVAAIERDSLTVLPFPMALGCRPGTHRLIRETEFARHGFEFQGLAGKVFLCPPRERLAPPAKLDAVFFLESAPPAANARPSRYRMTLEPPWPEAAARLGAIAGIRNASTEPGGRAVVVDVESGAWVAPAVEGELQRAGVLACDVDEIAPQPDFTARPTLTPLRTTEGVLGLLRHLRGFGALKELAAASAGGFGGLLLFLAERLRGVRFFRVTPGRLPRLVETIRSAAEATLANGSD